ncbi:MAG: hypothetical protein HY644_00235 [Acidobacteria bacterium]|nr:hypothetical protein [Acidobacteriota bacterium]
MAAKNGKELQHAMALMMQNQAALMQQQTQFLSHLAETRRQMAEFEDEIRRRLGHIEAILLRHEQTLAGLPEAIRQKVGFKPGR